MATKTSTRRATCPSDADTNEALDDDAEAAARALLGGDGDGDETEATEATEGSGSTETASDEAEKRTPKRKPKAVRVLQVRAGRAIQWPDGSCRGEGEHRGVLGFEANGRPIRGTVPAYRVREDDPFIEGWRHQLEEAPKDAKPVDRAQWPPRWRAVAAERRGFQADTRSNIERRRDAILSTSTAEADGIAPPLSDEELRGQG